MYESSADMFDLCNANLVTLEMETLFTYIWERVKY